MTGALRADALPRIVERPPLALATDDRNIGAARDLAGRSDEPIGGDRLRFPLQLELSLVPELDRVAHEPHRLDADEHLSRLGRLLEPRRDVDGVPGRQPLLGARHDLAGVHADSPTDPELRKGVAHLDRRPAGAQGVVLVHDGHAEDGHHSVADEFLDACRRGARRSPSSGRSSARAASAAPPGRSTRRAQSSPRHHRRERSRSCAAHAAPRPAPPARRTRRRTSRSQGSRGRTLRKRSRHEAITSSARPPSARPRSESCRPRSRGPRALPSFPAPSPTSRR